MDTDLFFSGNNALLRLACQSGVWKSTEKIQLLTGMVVPSICPGGMLAADWTCGSGIFYVDITFPAPFKTPPQVVSSISNIGPYSPCMSGAMDAIATYATSITTTGFRLFGAASPASGYPCTYTNGWGTAATAYIVVGTKQ